MMTNGKITVATALNDAVAALSLNESIDNPRLDAEVLLCSILDCERIFLIINKNQVLDEKQLLLYDEYISRRAKNEPVSYITGRREFMSLDFDVSRGILIPRPETEILVEEIIALYKDKSPVILDLCTGSGAIAVSLAYYIKHATVFAVDKYDICTKTAIQNAKKYNVHNQINVLNFDVLDDFDIDENFDCIVSNPPYICTEVLDSLQTDVKKYEPEYALDGGQDGLIFYRKITNYAAKKLSSGGVLAFEIGYDQGEGVKNIIDSTKEFGKVKIVTDLAGLDRVIITEKR